MKAVRIHEHGGPEVLRYEDAPEPALRTDEVLIKVGACGLNHLDLFVRGGLPGLKLDMPHILGSDAAGEIVEVGTACDSAKVGDRVLIAPGKSSRRGAMAAAGLDNLSRDYGLFGYQYTGLKLGIHRRARSERASHSRRTELRGSGVGPSRLPHRLAHAGRHREDQDARRRAGRRRKLPVSESPPCRSPSCSTAV